MANLLPYLSLFVNKLLGYVYSSRLTRKSLGDSEDTAIKRSDSEYSLGFSRSRSFQNFSLGELCGTGRLLSRLLVASLGLSLAGVIASKCYGRRWR